MDYFTSDLHFNHDRDFIYKKRGFNSVTEMNDAIVKNFKEIMTYNDRLFVLGDIMMGGDIEAGCDLLCQIPGNKYIVRGNHDTQNRLKGLWKRPNIIILDGFSAMYNYGKYHFLISHYPTLTGNFGEKHAPWNLSGHTHSPLTFQYEESRIYNVAVDAHDCRPVSIEQIIEDIEQRKVKINEN